MAQWIKNWFSNMLLCEVSIADDMGVLYNTVENYFQAHKTFNLEERKKIASMSPYEAKKYARRLPLRSDWEEVKFRAMEDALRKKFAPGTSWYRQLKATSGEIVEWNNWGDRIWGKTLNGVGENHLGKLLMKIRDEE